MQVRTTRVQHGSTRIFMVYVDEIGIQIRKMMNSKIKNLLSNFLWVFEDHFHDNFAGFSRWPSWYVSGPPEV